MDRLPVGEYKPALDLEDINRHYRKKTGAEDSGTNNVAILYQMLCL